MPISVKCPGCAKGLKAKETLIGRTVACPACGTKLLIGSEEDAAAAMLLGTASIPPTSEAPMPEVPADDPQPLPEPPSRPIRKPISTPVQSLPPLSVKSPSLWLRHLHWLLVLFLIPLTLSLIWSKSDKDFEQRLIDTIDNSPPDAQLRIVLAISSLEEGEGSLDDLFKAMPDHKLHGALLPRDSHRHWLFTGGAAILFMLFLIALTTEGSATPREVMLLGLFTATIGILLLLLIQWLASLTQGVVVIPRGIFGLLFWVVKLIGFSYHAAVNPENGFWASLAGFTLGVGLMEELCKALPILFKYRQPNHQTWLGAYLWGLASGVGFGLTESIMYEGEFYNGISGSGIYFVRNISCVALHALWTGSVAITIHRRQHLFHQGIAWHDWPVRALVVVAVPMILHGLYDTLLKKEMNGAALGIAILSFLFLAFQISRLRGVDDKSANEEMMKEYKRRRKAMRG